MRFPVWSVENLLVFIIECTRVISLTLFLASICSFVWLPADIVGVYQMVHGEEN